MPRLTAAAHVKILMVVPLSVVISTATSCKTDFCDSSPQSCQGTATAGEGTDTSSIDKGREWCAEVWSSSDSPEARTAPPMPAWEDVSGNGPHSKPEYCECVDEEMNAFLEGEISGGVAVILSSHNSQFANITDLRDNLWNGAENQCEINAEDQWPGHTENTCNDIIDRTEDASSPVVTPIYPVGSLGDCSTAVVYGPSYYTLPTDDWSDYYTLSNVIGYNSGADTYWIEHAFLEAVIATPAWLLDDGPYIDWNGSAWQIYNVDPDGDIPSRLGLQTGDQFLELNNIDITTIDGAIEAHEALRTENTWALEVFRPGTGTITLNYARQVS